MICAGATAFSQPVVDINDTSVIEGNSGTTNAQFVITLSTPSTNTIVVQFTTFEYQPNINQAYPARAGIDFVATNGYAIFAPGETNKSVFVQVIGDTINEANEPFGLGLSLYGGGTLSRTSAQCMILDDDALRIEVNDSQFLEGPLGVTQYVNVSINVLDPTEQVVYGTFSTAAGTADSTDLQLGYGPNRWTFDSGSPQTNFLIGVVGIYGDNLNEDDETFFVNAGLGFGRSMVPKDTNPQNARGVVFLNQGKCTIINDDSYLTTQSLSSNRTQVNLFGASGSTNVLQSSSDFANWTSVSTNVLGTNREASVTVTNSGKLFYRSLRVVTLSQ